MAGQLILVRNESTLVTAEDAAAMTRACNRQARDHASPAWHMTPPTVRYLGRSTNVYPGSWVITLVDTDSEPGALGWHTEEKGVVFGRVAVKPCLDAGSTALRGTYAVSSVLSHEVLETMCDPAINEWADTGRGYLVAKEVCDPVEADVYDLPDRWRGPIAVSNFVKPAWFDEQATRDLDYLGRCTAPLSMTPGGYWVQAALGTSQQEFKRLREWEHAVGFDTHVAASWRGEVVFSAEVPAWRRQAKLAALSRGYRKATGRAAAS